MPNTVSPAEGNDRPPAILIVEDEVLIRMAIAEHLQDCGYRVFEASNAAEAIAVLDNREVPIDLVFTDVRMPGQMDGWGLAAWVREHHPKKAVIVASGERQEAVHKLCQALPFLRKPYNFDDVVARIAALIGRAA